MPSSSPYQGNDYNALSTYRGYRLPVSDIFRANTALDAYWDQGAEKVKNAYNNVLDLSLVTNDNKQIRDQFIQDSQKQITKLSSMNLADPGIQRQGMGIFSPIMRDQDIVGEDYVVKNANNELQTAEQSRTKDGGKYYNPFSADNIQHEKNLLSVDPVKGGLNTRQGWRSIAPIQSKYVPYSDMTKETNEIAKTVHEQDIQAAQLTGNDWLIQTTKTKGVSKDRMLEAINTLGSPQLKAQMAVEARHVFYQKLDSDPSSVDAYYQGLGGAYYDTKINELKNQQAQLLYDNYMTPLDAKDPDVRQSNKLKIDANNTNIDNLTKTITKYTTVDKPNLINTLRGLGNAQNLSGSLPKIEELWQMSSMDNLAGKLAWQSQSTDLKANPAKIAQENLSLGYQRNNTDLLQLAETKRHNLADEETNMLKALKEKESVSLTTKGLFAQNGGTSISTALPSQENLATIDANADLTKTQMSPERQNEALGEVTIKNIIGQDAMAAIQQAIPENKKMGDVLLPDDMTKVVEFMNAYKGKYPVANGMFGIKLPNLNNYTPDQFKSLVSEMNSSDFKSMMSNIAKQDIGFTTDLMGKVGQEKGPEAAAAFRSTWGTNLRDNQNLSNLINTKVSKALDEYSPLFTNNGKTLITDSEISNAYSKGIQGGNLRVYTKEVIDPSQGPASAARDGGRTISVPITKAEYDAMTPEQKLDKGAVEAIPTLSRFSEEIKHRTNHAYGEVQNEANQTMTPFSYSDKDKEKKYNDLQRIIPGLSLSANTDKYPDMEKLTDFLKSNPDHLKGMNITNPVSGENLPSVQFQMESFGKPGSPERDMVEEVNKAKLQVTGLDPSFYVTPSKDSYIRNRGASVVYAPFKNGIGVQGNINIINTSTQPSVINPQIQVNGDLKLYYKGTDGSVKSIPITSNWLNEKFQSAQQVKPGDKPVSIENYLQMEGGTDNLSKWLAGTLNDIEAANRKVKIK